MRAGTGNGGSGISGGGGVGGVGGIGDQASGPAAGRFCHIPAGWMPR